MIDMHTHILPDIDDGSRNVNESIAMLEMLSKQGVDTVVATPHFYLDRTDAESFIEQRKRSAEALYESVKSIDGRPRIALGAEVEFYNDLYSFDLLESLCIGETRYILLEMPFARWTDHTYQALEKLSNIRNVTPIIAHIERYISMQKGDVIDRLIETDSLVQINSSFVTEKKTRGKALHMIKAGMVCYLGSDCHNLSTRKPNIGEAYEIIKDRLGYEAIDNFEYWEGKLVTHIKTF